MKIYTLSHSFNYECEKISRIFFPFERIDFVKDVTDDGSDDTKKVITKIEPANGGTRFFCSADIDGRHSEYGFFMPEHNDDMGIPDDEKQLAKAMVHVFSEITGIVPPWGILTGVRPSKLMRRLTDKTDSVTAKKIFAEEYLVTEPKADMASRVVAAQKHAIEIQHDNSYSLYVSIPFCPTRCSYCSFVSHSIASAKKLIPDYVRLLCREIKETAQIADNAGLHLETVYIGGGTPTSLEADDLKKITDTLNEVFDMKNTTEFTVEAGRPDTIDREKLVVLKNAGVTRISINPQTFRDNVLKNIGRPHTAADTIEKFNLARSLGFDNINMDFIAGLSGDTLEGFEYSINKALELHPENITVHTLALKRSARLVTEHETDDVCRDTPEMVEFSNAALTAAGYEPYYMYRQSKSIGNLENVGWCIPEKESLYNIYMMEELHTVLACGGGAVTKIVTSNGEKIERIYNFKYPYEYINRFEEQTARKKLPKDRDV